MESFPYFLGFSLICALLSYGLLRGPRWMWYLGWAVFYFISGRAGHDWFMMLHSATDHWHAVHACAYLLGGFLIWLPAVIWWTNCRHLFGVRAVSKS
ncbi:MAG: hypothetical protein V4662_06670 [Verrucomicrobiota bacterium]